MRAPPSVLLILIFSLLEFNSPKAKLQFKGKVNSYNILRKIKELDFNNFIIHHMCVYFHHGFNS